MDDKLYRIDGVLWNYIAIPLCPKHKMEMDAWSREKDSTVFDLLKCEECGGFYEIPRDINAQKTYVRRKLKSKALQNLTVINMDDEAIPLASHETRSKDNKYFVKAILTESKIGKRVVIYAGEKGKKEKTQIFIEPEIKRLAFDQKDLHPSEIFTEVVVTFKDGTKSSISKKKVT